MAKKISSTTNKKKRDIKILIIFWIFSVLFLFVWFVFLQIKTRGYPVVISQLQPVVKVLSIKRYQKEELRTVLKVLPDVFDGKDKNFLVVFVDPDQLYPGGGNDEAFGILKIRNNKVEGFDIQSSKLFDHDTDGKFDTSCLIDHSPKSSHCIFQNRSLSVDFSTNSKNIQKLYVSRGGKEKLAGTLSISFKSLSSFLEILGPIKVEGFEGEFNKDNFSSKVQYYKKIEQIDDLLTKLPKEMSKLMKESSFSQKVALVKRIEHHLVGKDIVLNFNDETIQSEIDRLGWGGKVRESDGDYLMMVDANLDSLKTDRVVDRNFDYTIDFSTPYPRALLKLKYINNGKSSDWQTSDYTSYFRVYVPEKSWLIEADGIESVKFGVENEKKYFGGLVKVPLGEEKEITFSYYLPNSITSEKYDLLIQKQSGIDLLEGKVRILGEEGKGTDYGITIWHDKRIDFFTK